ncbi:sulfate adenylyltransferase subunit 1 [Lachnospiraceae bacterium]|nr:sulfate adenylyltransferase subunit 1 [Lachnospiraceae bacterium]
MRDLLKFITCGSVDDGKSTLIGHILYDSKLLYADQERALALESKVGSRGGEIDYSLLLDGLTEEREQGITIDVAYRYFTTDARSFIVADTPGHEEYTRNMAVGASFADFAVILTDAKKGVLVQTRRHARICSVMGIRHFVFAVNKMDLVGYSEEVFRDIEKQIDELKEELSLEDVKVIPLSATEGDNVTKHSENMPWYKGETLLKWLETVDVSDNDAEDGFYLPVQRVCRPDHTFRGFQGQIESGSIRVGDEISALPKREKAHVKKILVGDREADEAFSGQAVTIQLDREIDVSRGSVLEKDSAIDTADSVTATLIWMDDAPLIKGGNYLAKIGTSMIPAQVVEIQYTVDVNTGVFRNSGALKKNEIGVCRIVFSDRISVDRFHNHRSMGELILIDRVSFMTSACGVVEQYDKNGNLSVGKIGAKTRSAALGQQSAAIIFDRAAGVDATVLEEVEKRLVLSGRNTYLLNVDDIGDTDTSREIVKHLNNAGVIVLLSDVEGTLRDKDKEIRKIVYAGEEKDTESIVEFVKKVTSYDYDLTKDASYI